MREPWLVMLSKLKEFKDRTGNCNVPAHCDKLGRWVERQRSQYRAGKLSKAKVVALEELGFQWRLQQQTKPRNEISTETHVNNFFKMMEKVVKFVDEEGHGYIPQRYQNDPQLGNWAKNRRNEWSRNTLQKWKYTELEKAGFQWEAKKKSK